MALLTYGFNNGWTIEKRRSAKGFDNVIVHNHEVAGIALKDGKFWTAYYPKNDPQSGEVIPGTDGQKLKAKRLTDLITVLANDEYAYIAANQNPNV